MTSWGMSVSGQCSDRALLLLATFANLHFGELADRRRNEIDLDACEVRVNASTSEMDDGRLIDGRSGEVNRARSWWPRLAPPSSRGRHPVTAHPSRSSSGCSRS